MKNCLPLKIIMNFNIEVRKRQLQSLDQYISSSRNRLLSILNHLGWNAKQISEKTDHIACPINSGHKIPLASVDKHVQKCCLKSSGYELNAEFLSEPNSSESSITLDTSKKIEILNASRNGKPTFKTAWNGLEPDPLTSARVFTTFSSDERLALYDYCVQNTEAPPTPAEFLVNGEEKVEDTKNLTPEEILQRERNAKRRSVKYKSVHTGRSKSYTEVLREVIGNQMELYQEYVENSKPQIDETLLVSDSINNGQEMQVQHGLEVYTNEDVEKNDKTLNDRVSSIESYHEYYNEKEKDDYSDRRAKERSHKEHSRRRDDDRDRYRPRRRSTDRESRHSRKSSHHRNGYDRHHNSHRRSDRDRRY